MGYAMIPEKRTLPGVQRLFSMFPSGLPGIALVLLRISVASTVLLQAGAQREVMTAMILLLGFFTPLVALLAAAAPFVGPSIMTLPYGGLAIISLLNAVALALLGPGAYSFDAVRFGRRVVQLHSKDGD
jgi:uncharacterized membrane protein YphA (DoxX/SURF4 family)